jgi:hypothetical protein
LMRVLPELYVFSPVNTTVPPLTPSPIVRPAGPEIIPV